MGRANDPVSRKLFVEKKMEDKSLYPGVTEGPLDDEDLE
jgi:hypothetical protein